MTNGGTTAAQKRAVAAVSGPGKTTANTASAKAATDRKRKEASAHTRRKAQEEARRKKKTAARQMKPEARLPARERTARERRGPRSILPPAVSGRTPAVAFAERQPAPRPIVPAPRAPGGPRPIVPTPERKVKITNFNAGRAQATAPAGRGPKSVAPVTRRVAAITPAPRVTAPAPRPGTARSVRTARSTPTPPPTGRASGKGAVGYVVQLAAYRSQEDALRAYQRIRARHGGLLGGLSPVIQKKDLGAAGVFYRLAVGPLPSRDQARRLCNALIARGEKDCLVRKR